MLHYLERWDFLDKIAAEIKKELLMTTKIVELLELSGGLVECGAKDLAETDGIKDININI